MSRLGRLVGRMARTFRGGRTRDSKQTRRTVRARYESSETTEENEPLWRYTDYLSARAANSYSVRRQLKIRSRYEAANNSYFRGIVDSVANDLIGSGPRLQCRTRDAAANKRIQDCWHSWARAIGLTDKLRLMAKSKVVDGEAFGLLVTNRNLKRTFGEAPDNPASPDLKLRSLDVDNAVQLDLVVIESDQVMTPDPGFTDFFWVDGIVLDRLGYPAEYHVLRHHPGDLFIPQLNPLKYDRWQPRHVCHWFRRDRPGQARGVPEVTPALDLFAQLRRFTKAVLTAAESAADLNVYLKTQTPANTDPYEPTPFDTQSLNRGMLTTLPWGTEIAQLAATQPATTYEMFVRVLLREICRCLNVPLTLALNDFSQSNYASGRLENLGYHRQSRVDRHLCVEAVLDLILAEFLEEAVDIPGLLPEDLESIHDVPHRWFWDTAESINPVEEAQAEQLQLQNGTKTLGTIFAERGEDWKVALRQTAEETSYAYKLATEFDIPVEALLHKSPEIPPPAPAGVTTPGETKARARVDIRGRKFDESKVKRADDGKFGEGGSGSKKSKTDDEKGKAKDDASTRSKERDKPTKKDLVPSTSADTGTIAKPHQLTEKAAGLKAKVRKFGGKAVRAAKAVGSKVTEYAARATWAAYSAKVYADDIADTAHDYSKLINDKGIAQHLGLPAGGSAIAAASSHVLAYGFTKLKAAIAKRHATEKDEQKAAELDLVAGKTLSARDKARDVAELLAVMMPAIGCPRSKLPTADDVFEWMEKREVAAHA